MTDNAAPARRLRRLVTCLLLAAGAFVAGLPGTAYAGFSPCPPGVLPASTPGGAQPNLTGGTVYLYTLVSSAPTFNASDSRAVTNGLDSPISATFTSQVSQTFSLSATVGSSVSLFKFLTASVSVSIQSSRTTSIGVSATATVPPHSRVQGDYGVDAFNVTYDMQAYRWVGGLNACQISGSPIRVTSNAPTNIEGWRFTAG